MLFNAATATPLAATHSDQPGVAGWLVLGLAAWAAGYLLLCWIWPFRNCRRCNGWGKHRAPIGRGFRHCPRCDGTGHRLRTGRLLLNHLRDIRGASK
ncbi:hypothetical protein [Actinopolymorpha pittospori]|uniref:Uncharacterized protein n=1 Tax=Actinopolymorpha pittospori TaxID=648752 RepID=A0A927N3N1_9ACTN|nr:hypothetical protein [Actinopolymorpha pittospori]MBE1612065.1 hypothetical protein [Actinopolymorpha pittospori]